MKKEQRKKISYWDALTDEEITEFLKEESTCRIGLSIDNKPYVVPLAYIYYNGKIYLHWYAGHGLKDKYAKKNPNACFEVDVYTSDHLYFKSIIAFGVLKKVKNVTEKREALEEFIRKYPEFNESAGHPKIVKLLLEKGMAIMARLARIYEFEVEQMTGIFQDVR